MMSDTRLFRQSDPDFPTTKAARMRLIAVGRVEGQGPRYRPHGPQHGPRSRQRPRQQAYDPNRGPVPQSSRSGASRTAHEPADLDGRQHPRSRRTRSPPVKARTPPGRNDAWLRSQPPRLRHSRPCRRQRPPTPAPHRARRKPAPHRFTSWSHHQNADARQHPGQERYRAKRQAIDKRNG
jgi:hypothetical protein